MAAGFGGGRRQSIRRDKAARRVAAAGTFAVLCWLAADARALPPADDFLNPQKPGLRLVLMPFIGPGFRTGLDHRLELEEEVTELRTQLLATVAVPFAEVSANVDLRLFLMSFGATAAYHDEWHLLQFEPDPTTGRDRAGQPPSAEPPATTLPPGTRPLTPDRDPAVTFLDLDRIARAMKDQHGDVAHAAWPFYEGRWGFVWPGYGFMGVSTLSARYEPRPEVSYDWDVGTVVEAAAQHRADVPVV